MTELCSKCFNPCFIGTYSFTNNILKSFTIDELGFNPCFIGTYSFTYLLSSANSISSKVLILVLLELILLLCSHTIGN